MLSEHKLQANVDMHHVANVSYYLMYIAFIFVNASIECFQLNSFCRPFDVKGNFRFCLC